VVRGFAVLSFALAVVSQRFDDSAVADATVTTFVDHPREFSPERLQCDPAIHLQQVFARDTVDVVAQRLRLRRHREQLAFQSCDTQAPTDQSVPIS
jgi:hypothetical protein